MIFRRKLRYVLVEATSEVDLSLRRNEDELKEKLRDFMGETDYSKANPRAIAQLDGSSFIISVNRGSERSLVLAVSFVKELDGRSIGLYTIKISGTVRSLKDYFAKIHPKRGQVGA